MSGFHKRAKDTTLANDYWRFDKTDGFDNQEVLFGLPPRVSPTHGFSLF